VPSWEKTYFPVGIKISSKEDNCFLYKKNLTDKENVWDNDMSHQQSSQGQQPQQQQPQQEEAGLTMDQILQYLVQHTMAIEQLLSQGQI